MREIAGKSREIAGKKREISGDRGSKKEEKRSLTNKNEVFVRNTKNKIKIARVF